ncbi:MAG: Ldh family oxidoreductase, partial [Anaerolineae bacterium]|nr:Ldh family oxidoreductase [Anaerolineae bacterium]
GSVALSQVNHIGRLGEYAQMLAERGLIGLVMTAGSMVGGSVTPYAGRERRFSTNPMAWAVPVQDGRAPLVLDFATSMVAEGKLQVARSKGLPVPEDWIYDREGRASTDPNVFYDGGMLRTFGSYKGSGLSMMIEIVATLLSGFAPVSTSGFKLGNPTVMIALQIERFTALDHFEQMVDELIERVQATPPAEGFEEVLVPGEPEARSYAQRVQDGIPLPDSVWQELAGLANELGVPLPDGV